MVTVGVCSKLKTTWKSVVFAKKVGKNSRYFVGVSNKTIIPLVLVGYEVNIAHLALRVSLAIYHNNECRKPGKAIFGLSYQEAHAMQVPMYSLKHSSTLHRAMDKLWKTSSHFEPKVLQIRSHRCLLHLSGNHSWKYQAFGWGWL